MFVSDVSFFGLGLLRGVPQDLEGLPKVSNRIAFPETNHYGNFFQVEQKFDANNVAYTGASIGFHTDLPYYQKTPSVQNKMSPL